MIYEFRDEKGDVLTLFSKHVLVEMEVVEEKTDSGIIVPESRQDIMQGRVDKGKLICVAEDVVPKDFGLKDFKLKIGDTIFIHRYAGIELKIDEKNYKIVKTEDVYAVLRKGENNGDKIK